MPPSLRAFLTEDDLARLREAMDWVIPPDSSPGAGTEAGLRRFLDLLDELHEEPATFAAALGRLSQSDLDDPSNSFAANFVERVRDAYYGSADTGAWSDIGFDVNG
ncbi:MAG TPA: hypothetical protein VKT78_11875 [Fimbriimonadaceae bacterium]|nr:hypothetical protein [Fimbriimonadaceae bacterium]